ncbi:uncharacterized protein LOC110976105 [Acanthaster planci]|uniref:Uncharacterized protein LOC110976105 n=1 Tax=Acanthaster planci TaxID=133434 RepID=A0A8B7XYF4_ACAPL|nr:uncharacterized protein LOC110976105 [Acanthaster planci]
MAPSEKKKGSPLDCKSHRDRHHHHRHHHPPPLGHAPPLAGHPPHPGFLGPPGFAEDWDPHFPPHRHFPGGPAHHFRFEPGPYGPGRWPGDPRRHWWDGSSDDEEATGAPWWWADEGDCPERRHPPRPGDRRGRGGFWHRGLGLGFGRRMWGPPGGFGRGGFGPAVGFGRGPLPHGFDLISHLPAHPWDGDSDSTSSEDEAESDFEATFHLGQYKKKNISVRLAGRHLLVEAKARERQGSRGRKGSCRRYFAEQRILPKTADWCRMTASLSLDGLLTIRAPPRAGEANENAGNCDRIVQVRDERSADAELEEQMNSDGDAHDQDSARDE